MQKQAPLEEIMFLIEKTGFGFIGMAGTQKGVEFLQFAETEDQIEQVMNLKFINKTLILMRKKDKALDIKWRAALLAYFQKEKKKIDVPIHWQGTKFQMEVWQALQKIPYGTCVSYSQIARNIGREKAVRAVASACAKNSVALIVPCHRVIAADGSIAGYRWGVDRKRALIDFEAQDLSRG